MPVKTSHAPAAAAALSECLETRVAAREVAEQLRHKCAEAKIARPDLLIAFGSFHHRALFSDALEMLRDELRPAHTLGCTVESVLSGAQEVEQGPGLSVLALSLPGALVRPFHFELVDGPPSVWSPGFIRERVSLPPDEGALPHRGILMLSDPFSTDTGRACAAIDEVAGPQGARIFGGVASGASFAGMNVLAADRRVLNNGIVGVSIFGDVALDGLVSQGCAPIGPRFVVTKAVRNEILELNGRPALEVALEMSESLPERERDLRARGLLVGIAPDAAKPRLGRGDFIVRSVSRVDPARGAITLTDHVSTGQTVEFHVRDARTADEDLRMLLDAEQLRGDTAAAILFSCNARGYRLFGSAHHDAELVSRRLRTQAVAGFHCAGEIGPLGRRSFVHTQTASVVAFRATRSDFLSQPAARA
jgi:small ligand-binding sensory domain FIST